MPTHIVLFKPRAGLPAAVRLQFAEALGAARRSIPAIRGFRIGRRITLGVDYERGMPDFPYAATIDFADEAGLRAYLAHPAHVEVGRLFGETMEAALVYDYELTDDLDALRRLAGPANG
jgi:hypothetical protein